MACTVSAQTLKTQCCCVLSFEGVNLSATSGYACQNPSLAPYLCPSTSVIPVSASVTLVTFTYLPHYYVSGTTSCYNDDVTLMPVSCSDCVLKICILSILACCTSVLSPGTIKSMLKKEYSRGIEKEKKKA